jgi:hypothetical protein
MTLKHKPLKTTGEKQTRLRVIGKSAELATPPEHSGHFEPGQSGNPGGRPKGRQNHATREMKDWFRGLFESEKYRASLTVRILAGDAPHMEKMGYEYLYGKPKNVIEMTPNPFRDLSDADLDAQIEKLDREAEVTH